VHILVGCVQRAERVTYGVVFRNAAGRTLRQVGRTVEADDPRGVALQAVLRALWAARRYGRTVRIAVDHPEVADWLARRAEVDPRYLTPFLQIRALLHAYRRVEVGLASEEEQRASRRVALRLAGDQTEPVGTSLWATLQPVPGGLTGPTALSWRG